MLQSQPSFLQNLCKLLSLAAAKVLYKQYCHIVKAVCHQ